VPPPAFNTVSCPCAAWLPCTFKGRHFEAEIIVLCVRWYLRFGLSFRNLEEILAERGLSVDHVTIWRWVQRYAPELNRRCRPELRRTNGSWRVDETYVRVAGKWTYLYGAVDSTGATIDSCCLPGEMLRPPSIFCRKRYVHRIILAPE
jgi:IS6 family transposase